MLYSLVGLVYYVVVVTIVVVVVGYSDDRKYVVRGINGRTRITAAITC